MEWQIMCKINGESIQIHSFKGNQMDALMVLDKWKRTNPKNNFTLHLV
jgi:hypothetical protein